MRRIIVSMNISLDGFIAGPDGELDWHFRSWTNEMAESLVEQLSRADTILLGGNTYSAMANYWPAVSTDLSFPREDIAFAEMMNNYTKIVFSNTLTTLCWNNSHLINGSVYKQVSKLKRGGGKDIIVYGSGRLVASLVKSGLIDEYILWIHPVILGRGKPLFKTLRCNLLMHLCKIQQYSSGVVSLCYKLNEA